MQFEDAQVTARFLQERFGDAPDIAMILGSGLSPFADRLLDSTSVAYSDLPHWPISTVVGHRGALVVGTLHDKKIVALAGRVHFYEGEALSRVVFPVRALNTWGVQMLFVTNSAGGIQEGMSAGSLMLITDHINTQGTNPLIGANVDEFGPRFPDMSQAYDLEFQQYAREAAKELDIDLKEGVYAAGTGPSYETPAEVKMLATLGVDAVGMSTVPEVIVARHMGMRVLGISCISNLAAGISDEPLSHEEVTETAAAVRHSFEGLLDAIVRRV